MNFIFIRQKCCTSLEIDFITSFKECDGFSTIMVCTDVFSSFTLLRALVDRSAATVATELVQIFSDFGSPRVIRTDGDGTWVSQALNAMFEIFGVRHDYIIPYNSRALGARLSATLTLLHR